MKVKASALCAGGGETEFKQGLRVDNGTTNLLILSLIISLNYERSKFPRFAREGEGTEFRQGIESRMVQQIFFFL